MNLEYTRRILLNYLLDYYYYYLFTDFEINLEYIPMI